MTSSTTLPGTYLEVRLDSRRVLKVRRLLGYRTEIAKDLALDELDLAGTGAELGQHILLST